MSIDTRGGELPSPGPLHVVDDAGDETRRVRLGALRTRQSRGRLSGRGSLREAAEPGVDVVPRSAATGESAEEQGEEEPEDPQPATTGRDLSPRHSSTIFHLRGVERPSYQGDRK